MKGFGLALIVFCFSLAGFGLTGRLSRRVRLLEQGRLSVQKLRYELLLSKASSLRVLQTVQRKAGGEFPVPERCIQLCSTMPFPAAWQRAVTETLTELSPQEQELFCRVGQILGGSDLHHQEEALLQCEAQLGQQVTAVKERLRTHGRLYNGLGILTGLMVAVVLL